MKRTLLILLVLVIVALICLYVFNMGREEGKTTRQQMFNTVQVK